MKKHILALLSIALLCISPPGTQAQQISVKSFNPMPNDLTARVKAPKTDQNGEKCALIKIVTSQKGFVFEGDMYGITATSQQVGEIWVYVPHGAKHITLKHDHLGILRNYPYPIPIQEACTYEMVLSAGQVETIVHQDAGGQYLVITVEPKDAIIYIDDKFEATQDGALSKMYPYGKHTYRVEAPLYETTAGQIEITTERKRLDLKLTPPSVTCN